MTLAEEHSALCVDAQRLPLATLTVAGDAFKKKRRVRPHKCSNYFMVILEHRCSNNRKKEHYFLLPEPLTSHSSLCYSQFGVL